MVGFCNYCVVLFRFFKKLYYFCKVFYNNIMYARIVCMRISNYLDFKNE